MKSFRLGLLMGALAFFALPLHAQTMDHSAHASSNTTMTDKASDTVIGVATAQGSFTTLLAAVEAAGLTESLMGEGPFTVFAPTDEAFGMLDEEALNELLMPENRERLQQLLSYHVIAGEKLDSKALQARANILNFKLQTMAGPIVLSGGEQALLIGNSPVVAVDVEASNGIIHVMGEVITPPAVSDNLDKD